MRSPRARHLVPGRKTLDDDLLEELETRLLLADVGMPTVRLIIDGMVQRIKRKELDDPQALYKALQEQLVAVLEPATGRSRSTPRASPS